MAAAEDCAKPSLPLRFAALVAAVSAVVRQFEHFVRLEPGKGSAVRVPAVDHPVGRDGGRELEFDWPPLSNQQIAAQTTAPGHPVLREHQFADVEA